VEPPRVDKLLALLLVFKICPPLAVTDCKEERRLAELDPNKTLAELLLLLGGRPAPLVALTLLLPAGRFD
jgi:hypothetical protein